MSSPDRPRPSPSSASNPKKKGRAYGGQSREIVYNVHKFLCEQKKMYHLDYNTIQSTADATGVSRATVGRIIREGRSSLATGTSTPTFSTPNKRHGGYNKIIFDSFNEGILRRKVYEFYVLKKERPSIKKLANVLKEEGVVECGREVIRKKINEMGLRWQSCQSNRKLLIEKPEIAAWRCRYLRSVKDYRNCQCPIVYLGETYLTFSHIPSKSRQSPKEVGAVVPENEEKFIVAHAGGEMGFVNGALLIFSSHATTGDYQGEMNAENFTKWLELQVVPKLPPNSIVVMDNAPHHCLGANEKPSSITAKEKMQEWLTEQGIHFSHEMTKVQLMEIINKVPAETNYIVDKILEKYGHAALRIPPFHPDLNAIELVWRYIKAKVTKEYSSSSVKDKKTFLEKCFSEYTQTKWQENCAYVKRIEEEYQRIDGFMDEGMDKVIYNAMGGSSSEESTSGDEFE